MVLKLLLGILIVSFFWFFFTQFFWPAWNNRRLFPMFRKDNWKMNHEMTDANTRRYLAKQRVEVALNDADAVKSEIEASKTVDKVYDDLIETQRKSNV